MQMNYWNPHEQVLWKVFLSLAVSSLVLEKILLF